MPGKLRQKKLREKLVRAGFVQVAVWCLPDTAEVIKQMARRDRDAME